MTDKPPHVQLHGISKKADENRRVHLLRVNPLTPTAYNPNTLGDKAQRNYISMVKGPMKMHRYPNTAEAVNHVAITRPGAYRTGDGDTNTTVRPGADDHKQYKSLNTGGDVTYPRSHK